MTQHLVVNREFERGDGQVADPILLLERQPAAGRREAWQFTVGGQYHDRMVQTDDGWRIVDRIEYTLWWDNPMPGLPDVPYPLAGPPPSAG